MGFVDHSIRVERETLAVLQSVAAREDVAVGQLIRSAIDCDLRRREQAKRDGRTDERLVAPLRSLLADNLARARDRGDLRTRLAAKGYRLKEAGGGLILVRLPDHARVCKASDLGYSHAGLAGRPGAPYPGHRQAAVVARRI